MPSHYSKNRPLHLTSASSAEYRIVNIFNNIRKMVIKLYLNHISCSFVKSCLLMPSFIQLSMNCEYSNIRLHSAHRVRHPIPVHLTLIIVQLLYIYIIQSLAAKQFIYKNHGNSWISSCFSGLLLSFVLLFTN